VLYDAFYSHSKFIQSFNSRYIVVINNFFIDKIAAEYGLVDFFGSSLFLVFMLF